MRALCILALMLWTCSSCTLGQTENPAAHPLRARRADYAGSDTCLLCHADHHEGWQSTLHSKMEQPVVLQGPNKTVKGDFSSTDPALTFGIEDVNMVVGSRFKQRYAKKIGDDYYMLPAQWNIATKQWVKYQPKNDWWAAENIYPSWL